MAGIKETKEALIAANEIALFFIERLKDGIDAGDAIAFWNEIRDDDGLKGKVMDAYDNWQAIPGEIADLDLGEALELGKTLLDYLPKFLAAFRK